MRVFSHLVLATIIFFLLFSFADSYGGNSPYPLSGEIKNIIFDFGSHIQKGAGSDQWVMTWADDDNVYGVWGDGQGWCGSGNKMSMGVTGIEGLPPAISGYDIWGGSDRNRKPLGIIADANKKIHLFWTTVSDKWDGSYGAISNDNGKNWSFFSANKVFSREGDGVWVVGIAQFDKGYTNIPDRVDDRYFYVFLSERGKDIYLGKALKTEIFDRSSYYYFNGLDANGNPKWSSDFNNKKPVFFDPNGMEYHVNVSYNPALDRFIFAKGHNKNHLGIFEGPNLWGPWKTIYYDKFKDDYWKFTYQFPQKWMSSNGLEMWMTWSGWPEYDNVSFIRAGLFVED